MPMMTRFREAATTHVRASPERVSKLLGDPRILRALDPRLESEDIEIVQAEDRFEVRDPDGHVHLAFNLIPEKGGTRVAAMESVRPSGPIEATKHMLFPGQVHEDLEQELQRLAILIEAIDSMPSA